MGFSTVYTCSIPMVSNFIRPLAALKRIRVIQGGSIIGP